MLNEKIQQIHIERYSLMTVYYSKPAEIKLPECNH